MSWPATVLEIGLAVFCFFDVLLVHERHSRWLPRWGWALALLTFPIVGMIGWICAGRHWRRSQALHPASDEAHRKGPHEAPGTTPVPPVPVPPGPVPPVPVPPGPGTSRTPDRSPDADLAMQLSAVNAEQERTLRRWEDDLLRREADLRRRELEL